MEHAKKWMLVDPSIDARHAKRHYSALDQNISNVLHRQDVDDREKLRLYQIALSKFLANRHSVESELNELTTVPEPQKPTDVDQKAIVEQLISLLSAKTTAVEAKAEPDLSADAKAKLPKARDVLPQKRGRSLRRSNRKRQEKRLSPSSWLQY